MQWYVYHLIDSRNGIVFYVGKGHGRRMYMHEYRARKWNDDGRVNQRVNRKLYYKILNIIEDGGRVIPTKVFEHGDEKTVLQHECVEIGRIGLQNLCNLTFGGEGETRSAESLKRLSEKRRAWLQTPEGIAYRQRMSEMRRGARNPNWGRIEDEEHKHQRMANMLAKPRWNKGLKGDPRAKGRPKDVPPHNSLQCRIRHKKTGQLFEGRSLNELSRIGPLSLATLNRLRHGHITECKDWILEIETC